VRKHVLVVVVFQLVILVSGALLIVIQITFVLVVRV